MQNTEVVSKPLPHPPVFNSDSDIEDNFSPPRSSKKIDNNSVFGSNPDLHLKPATAESENSRIGSGSGSEVRSRDSEPDSTPTTSTSSSFFSFGKNRAASNEKKLKFYVPVEYKEKLVIINSNPGAKTTEGPWLSMETNESSPILQRKIDIENDKLHLMTIGMPFLEAGGTKVRRVKIYEHNYSTTALNGELISSFMASDTPEKALLFADLFLRAPFSESKIVDKTMSKKEGIKGICGAQSTLLPLFGNWISQTSGATNLEASTNTIYLVSTSVKKGTVGRIVGKLASKAKMRKDDVRAKIAKSLEDALSLCWDSHADEAFSMIIVAPVGKSKDSKYFC